MKINIDVSEARILKLAMEGLKPREIEKQMAEEIRNTVRESIREKVHGMTCQLARQNNDSEYKKAIIKEIQAQLMKTMTPANIAKEFKREDWEGLFENVVAPVMTDFIEHALNEWLSLSFVVKGGKKERHVEVCGIDSYTHRKK